MLFSIVFGILGLYSVARFVIYLSIPVSVRVIMSLGILLGSQLMTVIFRIAGTWTSLEIPRWIFLIIVFIFNVYFISFIVTLVKDVLVLCQFIIVRIGLMSIRPFSNTCTHYCMLVVILALTFTSIYGVLRVPKIREYEVKIANLPANLNGLVLVQLTDIHASVLNNKKLIEGIVERTNTINADLILITGDLVDGSVEKRGDVLEPLSQLKSKYGVIGSDGNHDYYSGYDEWIDKYKSYGIDMLLNESSIIDINGNDLAIIGLKDRDGASKTAEIMANIPEDTPTIMLCHRPEYAHENSKFPIDLQLSGHTHGGMIKYFLTYLLARSNGGFVSGWYDVGNMKLYVSNGTNLWSGFPIRLGVPAEITKFVLRKNN